jgi:hypothetical protein
VLVTESGGIESLLVETAFGQARVAFGPSVSLAGERSVTAA